MPVSKFPILTILAIIILYHALYKGIEEYDQLDNHVAINHNKIDVIRDALANNCDNLYMEFQHEITIYN